MNYFKNIELNDWYISSQYFFAVKNESDPSKFISHAYSGDLINVKEGNIVFTKFELDINGTWTLSMGIKGTNKISIIKTNKPYMGLLNNTKSWHEDIYNTTFVGGCWELYNIKERQNYPNYMHYVFNISEKTNQNMNNFFKQWQMDETPNCTYSPKWNLNSTVNQELTQQIANFDIFYANQSVSHSLSV